MREILVVLLLSLRCSGHGLLHEQIDVISARIEAQPLQTELLVDRAVLFEGHGDLEKSRADLKKAIQLGDQSAPVYELLARVERQSGNPDEAIRWVRKYLESDDVSEKGLRQAGIIFAKVNLWKEAAACWERFERDGCPYTATDYDAASEANLRLKRMELAGRLVEEGLKKYDRSVPLRLRRLECKIARGEIDDAAKDFQILRKSVIGLEPSLALRESKMWTSYGYPDKGKRAAGEGLRAFDALPLKMQKRRAMIEMRQKFLVLRQ
jgi:tetratricopeptide (TPR) repeat protein